MLNPPETFERDTGGDVAKMARKSRQKFRKTNVRARSPTLIPDARGDELTAFRLPRDPGQTQVTPMKRVKNAEEEADAEEIGGCSEKKLPDNSKWNGVSRTGDILVAGSKEGYTVSICGR